MALTNDVIFSEKRAGMLKWCPRQYWYAVYQMWGGWWYRGRPPPRRAEEAYVAKFAKTVPAWIGTIIHDQAAYVLKNVVRTSELEDQEVRDSMVSGAMVQIDTGLKQVEKGGTSNPKYRLQLVEALNGGVDGDAIRERTTALIDSLNGDDWTTDDLGPSSNLFLHALRRYDRIVSVEDMVTFSAGGVSVFLAVDLMMRAAVDGDRDVVIVDWKTGKRRDSHRDQVMTYGAYAKSVGWRSVRLVLVYVSEDGVEVADEVPDVETVGSHIESKVASFLDSLSFRLVDGDLRRNEAIEDRFEPTDDPSACEWCQFQVLCARDGTKP